MQTKPFITLHVHCSYFFRPPPSPQTLSHVVLINIFIIFSQIFFSYIFLYFLIFIFIHMLALIEDPPRCHCQSSIPSLPLIYNYSETNSVCSRLSQTNQWESAVEKNWTMCSLFLWGGSSTLWFPFPLWCIIGSTVWQSHTCLLHAYNLVLFRSSSFHYLLILSINTWILHKAMVPSLMSSR